jgi:serine/alanine racemase
LLYAGATLIYLPVSIYAGCYSTGNIFATVAKRILFDGTFYHLWYFPALITGLLLLYILSRRFSLNMIFGITVILFIIGLLGDSYYNITSKIPFLKVAYDMGFSIFSYTRNGLFYAPVFLAMGGIIARNEHSFTKHTTLIGFIISVILMVAEGYTLRYFSYQRHDSMYIFLIPCVCFLFLFLLSCKGKASPVLRDISMWVYILHPLFIICVRIFAKAIGLTDLLIENSICHFLVVCMITIIFAVGITHLRNRMRYIANTVKHL